MVAIIDFGMGNLGSISNMLRKLGVASRVSGSAPEILAADRLILPGVGAFDSGMRNLRERGLLPVLEEAVLRRGVPCLGICLGMQLMTRGSEEGCEPGLGWLDADCIRFRPAATAVPIKVPHMGWNTAEPTRPGVEWLNSGARFYFVHSYHLDCHEDGDVLAWSTHGYRFPSVVRRDNVLGVQFHPEKSHRFGLEVLLAFAEGRC
jgi:glutamine amidotransferase